MIKIAIAETTVIFPIVLHLSKFSSREGEGGGGWRDYPGELDNFGTFLLINVFIALKGYHF